MLWLWVLNHGDNPECHWPNLPLCELVGAPKPRCDPLISHYSHCHHMILGGLVNVIHLAWERMSRRYFKVAESSWASSCQRVVAPVFFLINLFLFQTICSPKCEHFGSKQVCPLAHSWGWILSLCLWTRLCSLHLCTAHIWIWSLRGWCWTKGTLQTIGTVKHNFLLVTISYH